MKKFSVTVTQEVIVELDETKFDEKFFIEFRESYYNFLTLEQHIEHLAQLGARGLISMIDPFIEGYGPAKDMGIEVKVQDTEIEFQGEIEK